MFILLPTIFVLLQDPVSGDKAIKYNGMDKQTIAHMLSGQKYKFVSESDFKKYMASYKPPITPSTNPALEQHLQNDMLSINSTTNTCDQKLQSLIDLLRQKGLL